MHIHALIIISFQGGFFKSQYKELIENAEQSAEGEPTTEKLG